jgi:hypothetical protein
MIMRRMVRVGMTQRMDDDDNDPFEMLDEAGP